MPREASGFDELLDAMKRAAAVLRAQEIPYALSGGLAAYARGGPETEHDVDFFLEPHDAERALAAGLLDALGALEADRGRVHAVGADRPAALLAADVALPVTVPVADRDTLGGCPGLRGLGRAHRSVGGVVAGAGISAAPR